MSLRLLVHLISLNKRHSADSMREERIMEKSGDGMITLSSLASAVSAGKIVGLDLHQLNIILKVDLQGSIEAVRQALQVLPQSNISLKFLLQSIGDVSSSDVDLAVASKAIIFGFNVMLKYLVQSRPMQITKVLRSDCTESSMNLLMMCLDPVKVKHFHGFLFL